MLRKAVLCAVALLATAAVGADAGIDADEARVLTDKTLVTWVALDDYAPKGQCVVGLDNLAGQSDALVMGDARPGVWMAGSDWNRRTNREQDGWPAETAPVGTFVQVAIVHERRGDSNLAVTIVRNGQQYAHYEMPGQPTEFGVGGMICLGMAHVTMRSRRFAGRIDDARLYDAALSVEEIAALEPNRPSERAPWAWWNFENGKLEDVTGRYESLVFGAPRIDKGAIVFGGKGDAVIGVRGGAEPGLPASPPAPKEFSFVYSAGYGQQNFYPTDLAKFEELIVNLRDGGFNAIHCIYKPEYVDICRKHGMRMMLDVLAWQPPAEQDVRRPSQQHRMLEICRSVRGDDTIWGYNLWNERMDRFAPGGTPTLSALTLLLRKWDPTHPIWVGSYMSWWWPDHVHFNPGCPAYYDYHWERGLQWQFHNLPAFVRLAEQGDGYFGRWMRNLDYNRSAYTMNSSIAFGMKTGMWFINGPWHPRNPDVFDKNDVLCRIGRDHQRLWPEIGRIGRPKNVYTTPITVGMDGTPASARYRGGTLIPENFPLQVKSGEAMLGHFRYPDGTDALYIANHNARAAQAMTLTAPEGMRLDLFDRRTGEWTPLEEKDGTFSFELAAAAGELLRVRGGKLP